MKDYVLSHLASDVLLKNLASLVVQDRKNTAVLLAHLAEVQDRKLFLERAHSSMYAYCVAELGFSEDMAVTRADTHRIPEHGSGAITGSGTSRNEGVCDASGCAR